VGDAVSDGGRLAGRLRLGLVVVLLGFAAGVTFAVLRAETFGMAVDPDGTERLMDFASHRAFSCAAWSGQSIRAGGRSIYSLDAHLRATETWTHRPDYIALPFGYSPTMLWILGPTCLLPARAAFAAWSLAGVLAIAAVVLRARVPWTAMLPLATPLTVYALALGQTAVLSTAGLLYLMTQDRGDRRDRAAWAGGTVLWLLTAKPPLAITAAVAFIARRRWRPVIIAVGLTAVSTIILIPWLGPGWVHDYLALLGRYDRVRLPAAFGWSIVPESMSNLRAALNADLGVRDDVAVRLCNPLWATALAGLLAAAWLRSLGWSRVWSLAVLSYLLLCPHVSATENIALCSILAAIGVPRAAPSLAVVGLVIAGLWLAPAIVPPYGGRPSLLFFAMIGIAAVLLGDAALGRSEAVA
jgi:hypothetical protein